MIYVFIGKDFNVLNRKVDDLVNSLDINNIIKYDFSECNIIDIINEVNYVDLFNEKKLIIVSDFSFKKLKDLDEEILINYINNMNDNIIIFKCNDELDERKKITKIIRNKCKVEECKKLDYKGLHEYITNMFKEKNIEITYNQIKTILDKCEYNPDYTISEVNKLIIYKIKDKIVNDKDIEDVISESSEKEMFRFIENIFKKDIGESLKSFKVLSSSIEEVVIIDYIEKQFRMFLTLKELIKVKSELEISNLLKVNPYVIKKMVPYINNYSVNEINELLYRLSDVDYNIKVLNYDKNKELEFFIISIKDINFTHK